VHRSSVAPGATIGLKAETDPADANQEGVCPGDATFAREIRPMIVVCEKCQTRFKLDRARLPARGAKVRCSRCRHRFHVKPEPPGGDPEPTALEDTAPVQQDEDPDLENPEFLSDKPLPAGEAPDSGEDEPVLGLEEGEEMLGFGEAEDFSSPSPSDSDSEEGFGESPPEQRRGVAVDIGDQLDAFRMEGPIEESGPGFRISDDAAPAEPGPMGGFGEAAPSPEEPAATATRSWQRPISRGARSSWMPGLSLGAGFGAVLRVFTLVVSLVLVGGVVRALRVFVTDDLHGPSAVRGVGWTASDLETFHTRDVLGNRVLVVRGSLEEWRNAQGRHPRPVVLGTLLDREGRPIGEEVVARPIRLGDRAITPDQLEVLFSQEAGSGHRTSPDDGADVDPGGFTLLFPDPPPNARQVRLDLKGS
jgi:predicted Zn finger-like uncharacterized protein